MKLLPILLLLNLSSCCLEKIAFDARSNHCSRVCYTDKRTYSDYEDCACKYLDR